MVEPPQPPVSRPGQPETQTGRIRWRERLARFGYATAWRLLWPCTALYLLYRAWRQPAYLSHWSERYGWRFPPPAPAPLIWLHAVSVGETRAAEPLVRALLKRYPDHCVLITNGTPTGRETAATMFADSGVQHCYLPYDMPWCVGRFLDHFRPVAGVLMEAEIWPNLIAAANRRAVPLALVNARLSEKSLARALSRPHLIKPALAGLRLIVAQTERDRQRLARLGCEQVALSGNLKFDVAPAAALIDKGRQWRQRWQARNVILLASSRDGEEAAVIQAYEQFADRDSALVVVPRHPQRFDNVYEQMVACGHQPARRPAFDHAPVISARYLLGDSMGEMAAYYGSADVAIIGGSLLPFGGQNLIEACAVGVPVIVGPHTFNFEETAEQAIAAGAAVRVENATAAVQMALNLLADQDRIKAMADAALRFAGLHRGATEKTMRALAPVLPRD